MLGGFLARMSALTFAMNNASARRGVLTGSVLQALAISVPFGVPFLFLATVLFGGYAALTEFSLSSLLWFSAAGLVHFVMGRYCNYRGTKAIGANLVGPLQDLNIIYSMAMAVLILDEKITILKVIGFCLVMFGPLMALQAGNKERKAQKAKDSKPDSKSDNQFTPAYAEGYLFALLSGLCYGTSPILIREGMQTSDMGASIAGSFVSYSAATLFVLLLLVIPDNRRNVQTMQPVAAKWFAIAGLFVAISQMLRYMALAVAPVTVVSPIGRLSSVFRIYFSWILNREHEVFSPRVIVGTFVSLFGALILSLDTGYVLSLQDWSPFWTNALHWSWP